MHVNMVNTADVLVVSNGVHTKIYYHSHLTRQLSTQHPSMFVKTAVGPSSYPFLYRHELLLGLDDHIVLTKEYCIRTAQSVNQLSVDRFREHDVGRFCGPYGSVLWSVHVMLLIYLYSTEVVSCCLKVSKKLCISDSVFDRAYFHF